MPAKLLPALGPLTLILGGARSGKSSYAERLVAKQAGTTRSVIYLATTQVDDEEMQRRVLAHRQARPGAWHTVEATTNVGVALEATLQGLALPAPDWRPIILLDCITMLVSNLLLQTTNWDEAGQATPAQERETEQVVMAELAALLACAARYRATLVLVSNEVGMGIVPAYPLGRVYRDLLGKANQYLAARADTVLYLIAGLPVELKTLAVTWQIETEDK